MKDASGTSFTCNIIARESQGGSLDARVVWEPQGLSANADMDYTVTVSNIQGSTKATYTYTVKVFKVDGVARKSESQEGKMLIL